ncbi:MAG: DUF1501 domain-containing protein [Gemmataceae bacterium]
MRSVTDPSRREFLRSGALGASAAGLALADIGRLTARSSRDVNCILLFLVGGPSQLDTFDPKPDAPENVRGPFRPIRTSVPGLDLCEHFPRTAAQAKHIAVVRSVHHTAAPIHETGHQLMSWSCTPSKPSFLYSRSLAAKATSGRTAGPNGSAPMLMFHGPKVKRYVRWLMRRVSPRRYNDGDRGPLY